MESPEPTSVPTAPAPPVPPPVMPAEPCAPARRYSVLRVFLAVLLALANLLVGAGVLFLEPSPLTLAGLAVISLPVAVVCFLLLRRH